MNAMKKALGYFLVVLLVVGGVAGVYFFLTKGYSGDKTNLPSNNERTVEESLDGSTMVEEGNITSDKIALTITSPVNGASVSTTSIKVTGKTSPKAEVFVNDQEGVADANGNFSVAITLEEGQNQIVVSVNNSLGNVAEESIIVNVSTFE